MGILGIGNETDYSVRVPTEMAGLPAGYRVRVINGRGQYLILDTDEMYTWGKSGISTVVRETSLLEGQGAVWQRIEAGGDNPYNASRVEAILMRDGLVYTRGFVPLSVGEGGIEGWMPGGP